ncbi:hypothetical protein DFH08DRAFT_838354 [Mycena albidolilacea]|uniref:BTB domain-containing protein n=1 Tax=Mycena albidolilacea TaxID=1033008 RepID=A0AAD7F3Z6_9AGAR|nr:hypothetical protein DFH08DRAFT_838354 [Mycena albidolilacea]
MSSANGSAPFKEPVLSRHPIFWFEDASLILQVEAVTFKVHRTLLARQSPFLHTAKLSDASADTSSTDSGLKCDYINIDPARKVSALDCEVLLQHLYHDMPLSPDSPFPQISSIVRASSPGQLDFPRVHERALRYFADLFPSGPAPFFHPQHLEEAFALATSFNVTSIQKGLLYSLVTTTNFDTEGNSHDIPDGEFLDAQGNTDPQNASEPLPHHMPRTDSPSIAHKYVLSPLDSQRCMRLMTHFIEHFSPILFTAPATPHMACTDVFASTWMKLVIQPAIDGEGVYKPLETLEFIKNVDWANAGLCGACVLEKNAEWTEEQETIWRLMDQWLNL